jgi:uncharacterized protein (TIGR02328 family)
MRLWHKDLVPFLPRFQLLGQWRECCLIAKSISENGTPNHILVNKIMDYPIEHFISYSFWVRQEMTQRKYKTIDSVWNKIEKLSNGSWVELSLENIYPEWMNEEYRQICYWNLKEKYLCGGITKEEWTPIAEYMKDVLPIPIL